MHSALKRLYSSVMDNADDVIRQHTENFSAILKIESEITTSRVNQSVK